MATESRLNIQRVVRNVRFGILSGYKPSVTKDSEGGPRYVGEVIIPPTHSFLETVGPDAGTTVQTVDMLSKTIREVAIAKFGDRADAVLAKQKASGKLPIRSGDVFRDGREEYKGNIFLRASNPVESKYPIVPEMKAYVGPKGSAVNVPADHPSAPYAGCRGDIAVEFWALTGKYEGVYCNFLAACFREHDARLGGFTRQGVEFGAVDGASADEDAPAGTASSLL